MEGREADGARNRSGFRSQTQGGFALTGLGNKSSDQGLQIGHSTKMPYLINFCDSKKKKKKEREGLMAKKLFEVLVL